MSLKICTSRRLTMLLLFLFTCSIFGQVSAQEMETDLVSPDDIVIEEEIIDAEIFIRVPESSVQPRTRTEELDFILNYLRRILIESNKELY